LWSREDARLSKVDLAGSARLELVSGVIELRPQEVTFEAMLRGWRTQQGARRCLTTAKFCLTGQ
jgi:hypothetical protein